jgi:hypothetical protein
MVSILREKFAHLNLTFSIGGQISFDVSDDLHNNIVNLFFGSVIGQQQVFDFYIYTLTGFPSRLGQNILFEIP